jgi:hypothetical protein
MQEIKTQKSSLIEVDSIGPEAVPGAVATPVPTGKVRKKWFPIGIFILLLLIESIMAGFISFGYFIYSSKNRVHDIESYTINYSITMAEAFADYAELSYRKKKFRGLRRLFREKIKQNTIDEAFFVLKNGKIVVHSNRDKEKKLKGNIANDEFAYNVDLILKPARKKSRRIQFTDYNILGNEVPFSKEYRDFIKQHVYKGIESTGWLFSRAVFVRKKAVGTVNFIVSKNRIYRVIGQSIDDSIHFFAVSLIIAFLVSLVVSIIVFIRYRSIQKSAMEMNGSAVSGNNTIHSLNQSRLQPVSEIMEAGKDPSLTVELISEENAPRPRHEQNHNVPSGQTFHGGREIKDAIPLKDK